MSLLSLLSTKTLVGLAASQMGLPKEVISQALAVADLASSKLGYSGVIDIVKKGEVQGVVESLYSRFLQEETMWPAASKIVTNFLAEHDPDGALFPILGSLSSIPLVHFEGDFDSVEDFLTEGLFPLLRTMSDRAPKCPVCGSKDVMDLGSQFEDPIICNVC